MASSSMSLWHRVRESRTICFYVVAWTDREKQCLACMAFSSEKDARDECDRQRFCLGNLDAIIHKDGIDLSEAVSSGVFYVALAKDGKSATGFFQNETDVADYIDQEHPMERGAPKNKKRDYSALEVVIVP